MLRHVAAIAASRRIAVAAAIHVPPAADFALFDRVLCLAAGGGAAGEGPVPQVPPNTSRS